MSHKNEERKNEIYGFINSYIAEFGASPTISEICSEFKIAKSTAFKYVSRLIDEGLVEKNGRYRMSTVQNLVRFRSIPIIGSIACGKPKLAIEDIEGYIPISSEIVKDGDYFALRANGDSMINAGISDGDIVYILRQNTAENGDIVVALIEDEATGETISTLKRFYKNETDKSIILHPENDQLKDIKVFSVEIVGIATQVLKKL